MPDNANKDSKVQNEAKASEAQKEQAAKSEQNPTEGQKKPFFWSKPSAPQTNEQKATEVKTEVQADKPKVIDSETRIKELTETLQRLQAEFENYQKRSMKQNDEYKVFANAKLIEQLLPVLDSLEAGMLHNKELVIVHDQIIGILKKNGVEKIKLEKGNPFDHDRMECLMQERNEKLKDGAVANVLIAGYNLNGKILRLAKVSVNDLSSKGGQAPKCESNENEKIKSKKENEEDGEKEQLTKVDYKVKIMEE
ncbi:MAG: nucleotide exchange factor GrpE [archaeon]|jgi:molecular chaperone GrpE